MPKLSLCALDSQALFPATTKRCRPNGLFSRKISSFGCGFWAAANVLLVDESASLSSKNMKIALFASASAVHGALAIFLLMNPRNLFADKPPEIQAVKREASAPGFDLQVIDGQLVRPTGNVD